MTYNSDILTLTDFAAQTKAGAISAGPIQGTNIEITAIEQGKVKFKINKTLPSGKRFSGTVTLVKFTAKSSGNATVILSQ
jgi:hypothetical protein